MLKKNRSEMSIAVIVAAVLALVIIVVAVAMLTGKFEFFSSWAGSAITCEGTCSDIGALDFVLTSKTICETTFTKHKIIPGKFSDVAEGNVCCCVWKKQ